MLLPFPCEISCLSISQEFHCFSFICFVKSENSYWLGWSNINDKAIHLSKSEHGCWRDRIYKLEDLNFQKAEEYLGEFYGQSSKA